MRRLIIGLELVVHGVLLVRGHRLVRLIQGLPLPVENLLLFLNVMGRLQGDHVIHIGDLEDGVSTIVLEFKFHD